MNKAPFKILYISTLTFQFINPFIYNNCGSLRDKTEQRLLKRCHVTGKVSKTQNPTEQKSAQRAALGGERTGVVYVPGSACPSPLRGCEKDNRFSGVPNKGSQMSSWGEDLLSLVIQWESKCKGFEKLELL